MEIAISSRGTEVSDALETATHQKVGKLSRFLEMDLARSPIRHAVGLAGGEIAHGHAGDGRREVARDPQQHTGVALCQVDAEGNKVRDAALADATLRSRCKRSATRSAVRRMPADG